MARLARVIAPGFPHHVTQRGNRRQTTFFRESDYAAYVELLAEQCRRYAIRIWGWCLMPNHAHLIAVPAGESGLRLAIGKTHLHYTRRVNFREGWRGHLWQGRFDSYPMDDAHLWQAARYIDLNPVRAGLVGAPEEWPWSSAVGRILQRPDPLVDADCPLLRAREAANWGDFLAAGLGEEDLEALRRHERTGRPLGSAAFVERISQVVGRALAPKRAGRKEKEERK
jgi:putative transposase